MEETLYVCAACDGDVELVDMDVNSELWSHAFPGANHSPIPVLRADPRACGFCGSGLDLNPWVFRCLPHNVEMFGVIVFEDIDSRLACQRCRRYIEAGNWSDLERRGREVFLAISHLPELPNDVAEAIRALIATFQTYWDENPATPAP